MSITLDDENVDVFKLYDEMAIACSKDIEGYKALIEAIEVIIAQKQRKLQDVKDKTIDLIKTTLEIIPSQKTPLHQKGEAVAEITHSMLVKKRSPSKTPPTQVKRARPARQQKTTGKGKVKRSGKPKKPSLRSKNIAEGSKDDQRNTSLKKISKTKATSDITALKCLYHPQSPVLDKGRQLCSSCKWKLITNGLLKIDNNPAVISFLKGETTKIPNLGQSMCPVHPAVPSYNQKTGLCKACQKKSKAIGVQDRHLTEEELKVLRNP